MVQAFIMLYTNVTNKCLVKARAPTYQQWPRTLSKKISDIFIYLFFFLEAMADICFVHDNFFYLFNFT